MVAVDALLSEMAVARLSDRFVFRRRGNSSRNLWKVCDDSAGVDGFGVSGTNVLASSFLFGLLDPRTGCEVTFCNDVGGEDAAREVVDALASALMQS
jgi:hypothetical protein